jgi:hypothetical protein
MLGLVMPELMELCRGVVVPPSVEELRSGSHEISAVPPSIEEVSQALGIEKSGDIDVAVSLSPGSDRHVVPIGDVVVKSGLLATVPETVIARDVCCFLAAFVATYLGSAVD